MRYDEFAFFNQQLAAMLRDGIPLEGALRQLTETMGKSTLRAEFELLEEDLRKGVPLKEAVASRKLPEFYVHMVNVGIASNDLPGVLLMLADYYRRVDATWTRLKGLMVYPLIVLATGFGLSFFLMIASRAIFTSVFEQSLELQVPASIVFSFWVPPLFIGTLLAAALLIFFVPALQRKLRWRVPAFKEARLAQVASAMGVMLKSGGNLGDALGIVEAMERGTIASGELDQWHNRLKHGNGQFSEMAAPGKAFPPLFLWLVTNAGEDLAAGFRQAGEVYAERANHRIEMFLYAALPFSILTLGTMILLQISPLLRSLVLAMNGFGS